METSLPSISISRRICAALICCLLFLTLPFIGIAQTVNTGAPQSWQELLPETVETFETPSFNLEQIKAEDAVNDQDVSGPWRFGYDHDVIVNVLEEATIDEIPGLGKIYRLGLYSKGALTINLVFDRFHLPEGATLHLYSADHEYVLGAYTSLNNRPEKVLGTELVHGSEIIVEYFEPTKVARQGELIIGKIVHGYRSLDVYSDGLLKALNESGDCNHDVACPTGNGWGNQISSVGMIVVGGGICSGALINNTAQDKTPYFLTARHCGSSYGSWAIRFNWESTIARCASTENSADPGPPYDQTANGVSLNATNSGSDFTLVTLDNLTPLLVNQWDLYFAGWDRSDNAPTQSTGIHHPSGDVKKICRDNDAATKNTINFNGNANAMMWRVADWDVGVTEPGSSGSPLFDQNQRIIGQLCCGAAACSGTDDNDAHDHYGRLGISWDGANSGERLKDWLDPGSTGATTLNGRGPDVTDPVITCPGNMMMNTDPGVCSKTFNIPGPTSVSDDCDPSPSLDFRYRTNDGMGNTGSWSGWKTNTNQTLGMDRWQIQWRATDESGNTKRCSYIIEIKDNEDPMPVCLHPTVDFNGQDMVTLTQADVLDLGASSDNCGTVNFVSLSPDKFTCDQLGGVYPVTVIVNDGNGNTAQCIANVTVDGLPCGWCADPNGINCPAGNMADYDVPTETFTVTSESCYNPAHYRPTDSHGFAKTELCGNGELIAEVTGVAGNGWAGIAMREGSGVSEKMLQLMIDGSFLTRRELRVSTGGTAFSHLFQTQGKNWLRLTRSGNTFGAYHSSDGVSWQPVLVTNIAMTNCIQIGLVTMNGASTGTVTGTFENVTVNGVAPLNALELPYDVAQNHIELNSLNLFPNPASNEINIQLRDFVGEAVNITLFNLNGQAVKRLEVDEVYESVFPIDVTALNNGTYLIRIEGDEKMVTRKFIVSGK